MLQVISGSKTTNAKLRTPARTDVVLVQRDSESSLEIYTTLVLPRERNDQFIVQPAEPVEQLTGLPHAGISQPAFIGLLRHDMSNDRLAPATAPHA
jgi:hypothetical protein